MEHYNAKGQRVFHISQILTCTTGIVMIDGEYFDGRMMEGIYEILNYLTGDNLFTNQLPRAMLWSQPLLKKHLPWTDVPSPNNIKRMEDQYGSFHALPSFKDAWRSIDPTQEAQNIMGKDKVISISIERVAER